jgi:hypothetical protein
MYLFTFLLIYMPIDQRIIILQNVSNFFLGRRFAINSKIYRLEFFADLFNNLMINPKRYRETIHFLKNLLLNRNTFSERDIRQDTIFCRFYLNI